MRAASRLCFIGPLLGVLWGLLIGSAAASDPVGSRPEDPLGRKASAVSIQAIPARTGDLDAILESGVLRVLVEYSQTRFFVDGGQLRGFEYELISQFVASLKKVHPEARDLRVVFIPLPFDSILPALSQDRGDIAAAGLTVTEERETLVDFSMPYLTGVREAVVAGKKADAPQNLADLAGQTVHAQAGTSYAAHAKEVIHSLKASGEPAFVLEEQDIPTSRLLEMAHAGIIPYVLSDDYAAELWAEVLDGITVSPVSVVQGSDIAWALRRDTPQLAEAVNAFIDKNEKGTLLGNILFKRYFETTEWIEDPLGSQEHQDRLTSLKPHFSAASSEQEIEWLLLAAQGFQESRLDQSVVSPVGAIGVMQIMPATAEEPVVGGVDIYQADENILGGARYLRHLWDRYRGEDESYDALYFALAAYNAGPTRLAQARRRAEKEGLDPDRWFGNVEYAMMALVGREPIRYVGNIWTYYIAYRLSLAQDQSVAE